MNADKENQINTDGKGMNADKKNPNFYVHPNLKIGNWRQR
jgi:hypothetical protein